ncbi:MAG: alpha/beta hydrolase fold domain-containing protein, partial [Burkholderiales bacterium]
MTEFVLILLAAIAVLFGVTRWLRGTDMKQWDEPVRSGSGASQEERFDAHADGQSGEQRAVIAALGRLLAEITSVPQSKRLARMRSGMDKMMDGRAFACRFVATDAAGVAAEWVVDPGGDPARRALYMHGGAYTAGSPLSHRSITVRFAEVTGGAVLAIDYRLMPEHPRRAGIEDCRSAYRWLIENGPEVVLPATAIFVAGDSAGANLTLSLIAWVRDQGLRAPDAAVALSPSTDSTLGSPSLKANLPTDPMLGP